MRRDGEVVDRSAPWYRSFPELVPEGRAFVVDSLPRLTMRSCDYNTLADFQPWPRHEPGWFMLEWDIALDVVDRQRFAEHALREPDRIMVAPYWLVKPKFRNVPIQCHRMRGRFVDDGEGKCDQFGFGAIYWPQPVLDDWFANKPAHVAKWDDTLFSDWYRTRYGPTRIDTTVHPQHLHGD